MIGLEQSELGAVVASNSCSAVSTGQDMAGWLVGWLAPFESWISFESGPLIGANCGKLPFVSWHLFWEFPGPSWSFLVDQRFDRFCMFVSLQCFNLVE